MNRSHSHGARHHRSAGPQATTRDLPSPRDWPQAWRRADRTTRAVVAAVVAAAVVTIGGLVAFWPDGASEAESARALTSDRPLAARVTDVEIGPCTGTVEADAIDCAHIVLDLDGGATIERGVDSAGRRPRVGDEILVTTVELADGTVTYSFHDHRRSTPMWTLVAIFVAAVLLLGRWRGLGALAGLAVSLLVLAVFMLPALLDGHPPVLVAVVAASAIAFTALFLAHGVSVATSVALLGTFASLALTAVLSWWFVDVAKLSGFTDDSAYFLAVLGGEIDLRGILLAGFVIGALGVLDDVTVTQVSAVAELRNARPSSTDRAVFRAALSIGRDHISSTVNTLFLAYAGAALPLLLLFTQAREPISSIAGREIVATEIVRSLVGSIGLVAAVPITTWLAVLTSSASRRPLPDEVPVSATGRGPRP